MFLLTLMLSLRVHATSPHPFLDCGLLLETPVARAARARVAEVYARGRRDEGRAAFIARQREAVGRAVIANDVEPAPVRDFLKEKLAQ